MIKEPPLWHIFTPRAERTDPDFGHMRFEVRSIGQLNVPSGAVTAADALVNPQPIAFAVKVPPACYPVIIAIAHLDGGDQRIAAAMLRIGAGIPSEWIVAVWEDQEPAALEDDELPCYGVDSGTGSFLSLEAAEILAANSDEERFNRITARMQETYVHTREWTDAVLDDRRGINAVLFSSGFGDGAYPSFWGVDRDGRPLCLITDFDLVTPAFAIRGAV